MSEIVDAAKFELLARKFAPGSRLLRAWGLAGGISAQVTALEIEHPAGGTQKLIVRLHGEADRQRNPNVAADEFRLLNVLQAAGIAAPAPYFLDTSCEIFPIPCLIIEYVDGQSEFAPANLDDYLVQFAAHLAIIHALDGSALDLSFLPQQERLNTEKLAQRPEKLDESLDEGRIRDSLQAVWPLAQRNKSVLLHGDYWPGNIIWKEGKLAAVIDWEDAKLGDPLADLANARLDILWAFGIDAMHSFTRLYQAAHPIDLTNLPYWDLCAALRPAFKIGEWAGGDAAQEQHMRDGHRQFVALVYEKLGV